MSNQTITLKPGSPVFANGYAGTVVRQYGENLYEVRLPGGIACIDAGDITPLLDKEQLDELCRQYAKIEKVNPCGAAYPQLVTLLDSLSQPALRQLAEAGIKFVSLLARNRVRA